MSGNLKENVTRGSIWLRLVWMIVLGIAFNVAQVVVFAISVFQFLSSLFTGNTNENLTRLSHSLARYLQKIVKFMTFVSEEKPFPFSPWDEQSQEPTSEPEITDKPAAASESDEVVTAAVKKARVTKKPATRRTPNPKKTPASPKADKSGK